MGLQDIQIGFGEEGERTALSEAVRVLQSGGTMTLVDEYPFSKFDALLNHLPVQVLGREEHELDVRWDRRVAERAIALYAEGWVAQARTNDPEERKRIYGREHSRMKAEMERQLHQQGHYVPFGPMRMVTLRKAD